MAPLQKASASCAEETLRYLDMGRLAEQDRETANAKETAEEIA
ncbi:MAG: hypothetical protein ACR2RV_02125 [Verrucomicrobiales bacterium]